MASLPAGTEYSEAVALRYEEWRKAALKPSWSSFCAGFQAGAEYARADAEPTEEPTSDSEPEPAARIGAEANETWASISRAYDALRVADKCPTTPCGRSLASALRHTLNALESLTADYYAGTAGYEAEAGDDSDALAALDALTAEHAGAWSEGPSARRELPAGPSREIWINSDGTSWRWDGETWGREA
jgi:hypothetical protein